VIPGPTGTFTYWDWPEAAGGDGFGWFEWTVTPHTDPTPDGYFWSHQFWLVGGPAGYCGLQTVGSQPMGKIAIFSIWDAESATGPEFAQRFTGEGDGYSVRLHWPWVVGEEYTLGVAASGPSEWSATVDGYLIGTIRVPPAWGGLARTSVMWTERYLGRLHSLADIHRSEVRFGTPSAGGSPASRGTPASAAGASPRAVAPLGHRNVFADPPGSPGSDIQDVDGGVVQVMGGSQF
jgi:hypothetical protein